MSRRVCRNGSGRFTVASAGSEVIGYRWRLNGIPLPYQTFSFFDIVWARYSDRGLYDCIIASACGEITSRAAAMSVCEADFNCSNQTSVQDIFDYLAVYFAGCPV